MAEPFTADQKASLKQRIEAQLEALTGQIIELEELTKPVSPDNAIGRVSRMDAINNRSVSLAGLRSARSTFNKLERALTRLEEPGFGLCSRCKQPIPFGRLEIMPYTTRCVRCAARG